MTTVPRISEGAIRARVGEASFAKGVPYAGREGVVFDTKRQGMTLKGRVQGREAEPYRVGVTCDDGGIVGSECTCAVGGGGYCKHVAALLLLWEKSPEAFAEVEDLDAALARRDKEELADLIRRMIRRAPELELLLELPPPGQVGELDVAGLGPDTFRRRAATAFRLAGGDHRAAVGIAADLQALKALGDEALECGEHTAASIVYEGVLAGIVDEYAGVSDDDGEVAQAADECVEGLGCCLDLEDDPDRREAILQGMVGLYRFDIDHGGIGLGDEVPGLIVGNATTAEKARVAAWAREALPPADDADGDYRRRILGAFLLDLEAETIDDDAYLAICRETGRSIDLIDRLLSLGRDEEALAALEAIEPADHHEAVDLFAKHGRSLDPELVARGRRARTAD